LPSEHCLVGEFLADGLGDAKIDHARHRAAVALADQHVGRFDIAMNDPFLMSMLNRLAYLDEKLQSLAIGKLVRVAVAADWLAGQQSLDFAAQSDVSSARVIEKSSALYQGQLQRIAEDRHHRIMSRRGIGATRFGVLSTHVFLI